MDRYHRVEKPRPEEPIGANEIRITSQGLVRNYVTYGTGLLQDKMLPVIVLKAMGQAISKAVAVVEIIKKRNTGLQQETAISSVSITDVWEPIEEGLVPLETTRHVSVIAITLSQELSKKSNGNQPLANVNSQQKFQQAGYYPQQHQIRQNQDSYGRGRGRGRGRSWGWDKGGYGGYHNYTNGYSNNRGGYNNSRGGYNVYHNGYVGHQGGRGGYRNNHNGYGNNQNGYGGYQENGGRNNYRGGGRGGRGNWNYSGLGSERGGDIRGSGVSGYYPRGQGRMGRGGFQGRGGYQNY